MSVEMPLAEFQHHSAQRQKKARARKKEREVHYTSAMAASAEGAGSAARDGPHRRRVALRADPRCTGAAKGGPTGGLDEDARHAVTCYRCFQDLS